jgi:hypothetical protein
MKHLKQHPLKENSYLSNMADMELDADATIVTQERPDSGNAFQKLSQAAKGENDTESTYKINKSELNQKLSTDSAIETEVDTKTPKIDSSYQKLSHKAQDITTDAPPVMKITKREGEGDTFQKLSHKPEVDKVGSTFKRTESELDQKLSNIASESIKSFKDFSK